MLNKWPKIAQLGWALVHDLTTLMVPMLPGRTPWGGQNRGPDFSSALWTHSITSVSWTKALWAWLRQLAVEAQTSWEGRWRSTPAWHTAEWSTSCLFLACVRTEFFVSADWPSCGRCTCWFSAMNIWDFGDTVMQCDFMNTPSPHEVSPVKINNPLPATGTCTLA